MEVEEAVKSDRYAYSRLELWKGVWLIHVFHLNPRFLTTSLATVGREEIVAPLLEKYGRPSPGVPHRIV